MKEFLKKLTSRKLWLAISGVVTGIAIALGADGGLVETIAGAVTSAISAITYIIVEGRIDANSVKTVVENVQTVVDAVKEDENADELTD